MKTWIMVYEGDDGPGAKPTDAVGPFDDAEQAEKYQARFKRLESWGYVQERRKPIHLPIYSVAGDDGVDYISHCPPGLRGAYAQHIAKAEAAGRTVT